VKVEVLVPRHFTVTRLMQLTGQIFYGNCLYLSFLYLLTQTTNVFDLVMGHSLVMGHFLKSDM